MDSENGTVFSHVTACVGRTEAIMREKERSSQFKTRNTTGITWLNPGLKNKWHKREEVRGICNIKTRVSLRAGCQILLPKLKFCAVHCHRQSEARKHVCPEWSSRWEPEQSSWSSHFVLLHISTDRSECLICAKLAFLYLSHLVVVLSTSCGQMMTSCGRACEHSSRGTSLVSETITLSPWPHMSCFITKAGSRCCFPENLQIIYLKLEIKLVLLSHGVPADVWNVLYHCAI